jgi:uncharacterized protein YqjF (DUF2071 family)
MKHWNSADIFLNIPWIIADKNVQRSSEHIDIKSITSGFSYV